jgi:hypothetical protein
VPVTENQPESRFACLLELVHSLPDLLLVIKRRYIARIKHIGKAIGQEELNSVFVVKENAESVIRTHFRSALIDYGQHRIRILAGYFGVGGFEMI